MKVLVKKVLGILKPVTSFPRRDCVAIQKVRHSGESRNPEVVENVKKLDPDFRRDDAQNLIATQSRKRESSRYCRIPVIVVMLFALTSCLISCGEGDGASEGCTGDNCITPPVRFGKAAHLTDVDASKMKESIIRGMEQDVDDYNNSCQWVPVLATSAPGAENTASTVDFTDTNIQEAGVDEADMVKTDGKLAYVLSSGKLRIFRVWPFAEFGPLGEIDIEGTADSLYIKGGRAIIFSWTSVEFGAVKVTIVDIGNPSVPKIERESYYEGRLISSRRIDNDIHIVLDNRINLPPSVKYDVDYSLIPNCGTPASEEFIAAVSDLKKGNRAIIEGAKLEELFPKMIRNKEVVSTLPAITLKESELNRGNDLLMLVTINLDNPERNDFITAVKGLGNTVYASRNAIYVAQTVYNWDDYPEEISNDSSEITLIHRFDLVSKSIGPRYTGTGTVAGHLLYDNAQFAMSEYEGFLRVATTVGHLSREGSNSYSNVFVLDTSDADMETVGSVTDLGKGESIYAVRFIGPTGYVVTFKKVDPLFVIDLGAPTNPRIAGELKVPGYSTYLHPFNEDNIIGLGKDAEDMGTFAWYQGVKLSMFDVSDPAMPLEKHNKVIGSRGTESAALYNHHAFTLDGQRGLLAIPITLYEGGRGGSESGQFKYDGLQIYRVSAERGFELFGEVKTDAQNNSCYYYDNAIERSIIIGDGRDEGIIVIKDDGISLHRLDGDMTELGSETWEIDRTNEYLLY